MAHNGALTEGMSRYERRSLFIRSEDEGLTWSEPVVINPSGPCLAAAQDVLLRTSAGRIVFPTYMTVGQGNFRLEDAAFPGGYVNGTFVSSDAHFFDPRFSAAVVFYSDDEGQTWQPNRDGELMIVMDQATRFYGCAEPSVTEVTPGKLLMMVRTRLGRHFQSWSYDNGDTWSRLQPTQLAGNQVPCQVRTFRDTGHLLCVFNQHSPEEIRRGYVRTRLSSAVSRNGGGVWEHFQNVESLHPETHVAPGPIEVVQPAQRYSMGELPAPENEACYVEPFPPGYGRWSYPSVLVLKDRVLISHTYGWHDETGAHRNAGGNRLKVLPVSWFYGGQDPAQESPVLDKMTKLAPQP